MEIDYKFGRDPDRDAMAMDRRSMAERLRDLVNKFPRKKEKWESTSISLKNKLELTDSDQN